MDIDDLIAGGSESFDYPLPELDPDAIDWVTGDGHLLDQWWQDQEVDGLCAPTSAAIVMSCLTGRVYDKDHVAQVAMNMGLLTQETDGTFSGMTALETERLIDAYGLDADVEQGSIAELRERLSAVPPIPVIVAVDSDEIWYRTADDLTVDDAGADHALVVAGIDERRGTVILADPGNPSAGRGYEVALAEFENAWADSDNQMIVTRKPSVAPTPLPDLTPPRERTPAPAPPVGGDGPSVTAVAAVIIPLVIAASALRRVKLGRPRR